MTPQGFSRVYRFRLGYDLLTRRIEPSWGSPNFGDGRSNVYTFALEQNVFRLWIPFGLTPSTDRSALRELYRMGDDRLLVELEALMDIERNTRAEQREARRERERREGTDPFEPITRRGNPLHDQVVRSQRAILANPEHFAGMGVDIEQVRMLARQTGALDDDPPRVDRRGRPIPHPTRPRIRLDDPVTQDVDADYVSNRSKPKGRKKGGEAGYEHNSTTLAKPKPKPKRRLVVGRKRPPVVED